MASFRISGLTKSYGSNVIVDDLDLEIDKGEFLVLLGPSGCGKTTTLRCLAGLETPEAGRIEFKGRAVYDSIRPGQRPCAQAQHRDGVPVVRVVAQHDGPPEHRLSAQGPEDEGSARGGARRGDRGDGALRPPARPLSVPAQRRPAAADRPGARSLRAARPRAVRRAAEQSRRPASRSGADRDPPPPRDARLRRGVRDARPVRGVRPRRQARDHERGQDRAAGHARQRLQQPRHRLRRGLHRDVEPSRAAPVSHRVADR